MMNWNIPFSLIAYVLMPFLPFIAFLIWCAFPWLPPGLACAGLLLLCCFRIPCMHHYCIGDVTSSAANTSGRLRGGLADGHPRLLCRLGCLCGALLIMKLGSCSRPLSGDVMLQVLCGGQAAGAGWPTAGDEARWGARHHPSAWSLSRLSTHTVMQLGRPRCHTA